LGTVTDGDRDEAERVTKCERRGKSTVESWVVGQAVRALGMAAVPYPMVAALDPPRPAALARVLHQLIAASIFWDCCSAVEVAGFQWLGEDFCERHYKS